MKFFNKLFKKEEEQMAALEIVSEVVTDSVYDAVTEAIRQEPEWFTKLMAALEVREKQIQEMKELK